MKKNILIIFLSFLGLSANNPPKYTLSIYIPNFSVAKGYLRLIVFNSPDGFPADYQKAVLRENYLVNSTSMLIELPALPQGNYAIAIFHDENSNNNLDFNWVGIPKEGYSFSNNAKVRLGPPSFQDAKFTLDKSMRITMELKYW